MSYGPTVVCPMVLLLYVLWSCVLSSYCLMSYGPRVLRPMVICPMVIESYILWSCPMVLCPTVLLSYKATIHWATLLPATWQQSCWQQSCPMLLHVVIDNLLYPAIYKMADSDMMTSTAIILALTLRRRRMKSSKVQRKHKVWAKPWLRNHELFQLLKELELIDTSSYRNFLRMDSTSFEYLLQKVAPMITYKDTNFRDAIPAGERLAVTLRFLATGQFEVVFMHTLYSV